MKSQSNTKSLIQEVKRVRISQHELANAPGSVRNKALKNIHALLWSRQQEIINQNKKDLLAAKKSRLPSVLLKRLELDKHKLKELSSQISSLAKLPDPIGKVAESMELDKGLILDRVTTPIGVIGVVFESRPDALVQIACLCIKSGNGSILKGGSEASNSNRILYELIREALVKSGLPKGSVLLIQSRKDVEDILSLHQHIDLLIPRGSNSFVQYVMENTKIPVLGHAAGICHVYVDGKADIKKAVNIAVDSKCQYPAVCNAMETLLLHKDIAPIALPTLVEQFLGKGVQIRGCPKTIELVKHVKAATADDWGTEYNDLILSIKIVDSIDEAISHINSYSSGHTDSIVTEDKDAADRFLKEVDSSTVAWNASTRFSDGYRFGKGAEVGISTSRIHARGPVGLEGLAIYKYLLRGKGHIVSDYSGKGARTFTHRRLK